MRTKNIRTIDTLDGIPGNCGSDGLAAEIIVEVVRRLGYDALSDAGIAALAAAHQEHDDRRGR
ncbi:MAG: hypothetical protein KAG89_02705 [Fulvimarina manganoxydans]|uniref:hypothetical protein n=1 Tax=Fulvimarina manganoxydans TaxID=937218 RepID=UPI002355571B|nr:hypothetical protein [Fulvimarina manganoxydans]MCK5931056.1 hypothetical protein [Fulvimarina manganoxydans]